MVAGPDSFELHFGEEKVSVTTHTIQSHVIFRVTFPGKRSPLVLTRVLQPDGNKFWTSVPEGRQREAEEVGALISQYFKTIK